MNLKRKMLTFKILLGILTGLVIYRIVSLDQSSATVAYVVSGSLGIVAAFIIQYVSRLLDQKLTWKQNTGVRLLAGILSATGISFIIAGSLYPILEHTTLVKILILLFSFSLLYNVFYFIFYSYRDYAHGQVERQAKKTRQSQLQLSALKSQLSPHFLFNSLNALSTLFYQSSDAAERFIRALAHSYSYVIQNYHNPMVKLKDELIFTKSYFDMMAIRFGPNIQLECNVPEKYQNAELPPLSVQMLVENAIKHNRTDSEKLLRIRIEYTEGELIISNNKLQSPSGRISAKVGLKNISERFELLENSTISVHESEDFVVKLPIVL